MAAVEYRVTQGNTTSCWGTTQNIVVTVEFRKLPWWKRWVRGRR